MRRVLRAATILVVAGLAAASQPMLVTMPGLDSDETVLAVAAVPAVPDHSARLTADGGRYLTTTTGSRIVVHNADSGTNNREVLWNPGSPNTSGGIQCATWTSGSGIAQNGIAFRIAAQDDGYNAIVFARNVFVNAYWLFAPKLFHTGDSYGAQLWTNVAAVDLSPYLGRAGAVYPLRVCVSLDDDDMLRFAVATGSDEIPPLSNPGIQGGVWKLPIASSYHGNEGRVGRNGSYAAHLPPGSDLVIDDIRTRPARD